MKIAKLVSQADQIIELRATLQMIADMCPPYQGEYNDEATISDFGNKSNDYAFHISALAESRIGDIVRNILNPPPPVEKPTKVYSKVKGKIMSWEVDTQDPMEAAKTVKEVAGINNPLFVFVQ